MALIDCRPAYLSRLQDYFKRSSAFNVTIAVANIKEFYDNLGRNEFDIVLCGQTPALETVHTLFADLQSRSIAEKSVLLAPLDDKAYIFEALCFGSTAFLPERLPLPIMEQRLLFHLQGNYWLNAELARLALRYFDQQQTYSSGIVQPLSPLERSLLELVIDGACFKRVAQAQKSEPNEIKLLVSGIFYKLHLIHRKERILTLQTTN